MATKIVSQTHGGLGFWGWWALAFLGFPIGGLAGAALVGPVTGIPQAVLGGAATGAVIGAAQWLVLRRRLPVTPWWIAATSLGMASGLALGVGLLGTDTSDIALPLRGLVTGAGIGLAQYLLLQRATPRAPGWVVVVTLGWAVGWMVTRAAGINLAPHFTVFGATGAWAFQLLTGLALAWMLRSDTSATKAEPLGSVD